MKKHFLDSYEGLIKKVREIAPGQALPTSLLQQIKDLIVELNAHIEALVSSLDQFRYWRETLEKEARELDTLKQTLERERKSHENQP